MTEVTWNKKDEIILSFLYLITFFILYLTCNIIFFYNIHKMLLRRYFTQSKIIVVGE